MRYAALLRGINVGGKNKLPMAALVDMFVEAGCSAVQSYIQSGNVAFDATAALSKRLPELIKKAIQRDFGYDIPVVIRSAAQLKAVVKANPFLKPRVDLAHLAVGFLTKKPAARDVSALDPDRSPGDSFAVVGSEIYLAMPNGAARSKLTNAYFDKTLKIVSTMRNWRTTLKLVEMTSG